MFVLLGGVEGWGMDDRRYGPAALQESLNRKLMGCGRGTEGVASPKVWSAIALS